VLADFGAAADILRRSMFARSSAVSAALFVCTSIVACSSGGGAARDEVRQAPAPIINGIESTDAQNAVILLGLGAGGGWYNSCSGTLIAPNLVLTARHCVSETGPSGCATITSDNPPDSLRIYLGKTRSTDWISHSPDAYGKKLFVDDGRNLCSHDIALILLDTALVFGDTGLAPIRLEPPARLDTFTAVGWGVTEKTGDPGIRMQRPDVKILKVDETAKEFTVGESICHGDSGGPALATGTGAVLGVVSRGGNADGEPVGTPAAGCVGPTTTNIYTGLWGFRDLILKAFAESGYEPWLEGQPDPRKKKFGGTCTGSNDCQTAICVAAPVVTDAGVDTAVKDTGKALPFKGVCSQECSETTKCPDGFDCNAGDGGQSVCMKHVEVAPPPPPPADGGGGGCSLGDDRRAFDASPFALGLLAAAALVTARRVRR
jgi:hypothetical protein